MRAAPAIATKSLAARVSAARVRLVFGGAVFFGAMIAGAPALDAQPAIAPAARVEVHLEGPTAPVHVGDPFEVIAHLHLRGGARGPWMLAPTSDGPAVEVVRGRLLSIDADTLEGSDETLEARLRIPVLARATGTTVLRARVQAYGCEAGRCRAIEGEGALVLEIAPTLTPR